MNYEPINLPGICIGYDHWRHRLLVIWLWHCAHGQSKSDDRRWAWHGGRCGILGAADGCRENLRGNLLVELVPVATDDCGCRLWHAVITAVPMMFASLDRILWRRLLTATALIACGTTAFALGLELVLEANDLFKKSGEESQLWLITRFYLYKIPPTLSPLLPLAAVAGCLLTFGGMLRRSELIVTTAGGLSLRRVARPAIGLALLLGIADYLLVDHIMPRLEGDRLALENQVTGQRTGARWWHGENDTSGRPKASPCAPMKHHRPMTLLPF